jgi:hypothetical protein
MTTDAKGATSIVEEGLGLVQALFIFVGHVREMGQNAKNSA